MQATAMLFSVAFAALFSASQAGVVPHLVNPHAPPGSAANPWPAGTSVETIKAHQAAHANEVADREPVPDAPPMPSAAEMEKEHKIAKDGGFAEAADDKVEPKPTHAANAPVVTPPDQMPEMEKEDLEEIQNQKAENDMADEATSLLHDGRDATETNADQVPPPPPGTNNAPAPPPPAAQASAGGSGDFTFKQDPKDYAAMWKLADEKAAASEKKQKELEARLDDVEAKKIAVNSKLANVDRNLASDQKHHDNLVAKHKETDHRYAKAYLTDADKVVDGKIELKEEKKARLQEAIDVEKKFQAGNEAKQKKKEEEKKTLMDKKAAQDKQKTNLMDLKRTETKLNQGVRQSQNKRLSDINEKIGLDTRGIEALTTKLEIEESKEAKLTKKLGEIVHNDEEVAQVRRDLATKKQQLTKVETDLAATKAKAAKDLKDCEDKKKAGLPLTLKEEKALAAKLEQEHGHGTFLAKATAVQAPEMPESFAKGKM